MSNDSSKQAISDDGRYMALTRDIRVLVDPAYLEERSDPDAHQFVWAYTIEIRNEGQQTVQLKERYWKIIDANGKVEHVRGSGVVGEQPVINPGEVFEYTSGCPLETDSGFMVGHYTMELLQNETFDIDIPAFALDLPSTPRVVN
ncbi:MAG: Co2+/Mg2+ efflux protein ApaG [Rhizobiaceae bacterium]|nr:Co2+/Mg2+ efflux protein ApaG [Rhizobiaceae bacterium]